MSEDLVMFVADLIESLKKYDPNIPVVGWDRNPCDLTVEIEENVAGLEKVLVIF